MMNSSKQDITSRHSYNKNLVIQIIINLTKLLAAPINIKPPNTFGYIPIDYKISRSNTKLHIRPNAKVIESAIIPKIASLDEIKHYQWQLFQADSTKYKIHRGTIHNL